MHNVMNVSILCVVNNVRTSTTRAIVRAMFGNFEISEDKLRSGQQGSNQRFLLEDNFNCAGLVSITNCIIFRSGLLGLR